MMLYVNDDTPALLSVRISSLKWNLFIEGFDSHILLLSGRIHFSLTYISPSPSITQQSHYIVDAKHHSPSFSTPTITLHESV